MGLYNNAFKTDDYAVAAFGSTDSEHIAALAEMGYEAAYGFNADLYAEMNEKGIEIAGANTMSAIPGNEAYDSYSTAEKIVASAKYYKEQGYSFENFDYSYYPFGMFTEGIDSYEAYAEKWEAGIESAVQMNKELEQAAQDLGYGEIDFWLTQENEPMGQPGQSALEVAMFINCVQHASDEAGVKNYMKVSVDLVHAYSFLNLELEPRAVTQQYCVDYMETQDWAKMLFYNSPYFEQELKIQIPETIEQYMSLLDGQVSVIQFSDNNGSTKSPFGEGKGSATGSHHVIGEGRIDYLEYMDALCNIAHMTDLGSYWVYEPWYNQNNETTQQNLVQGIRDGVMWMTEWNLLYAVDTL